MGSWLAIIYQLGGNCGRPQIQYVTRLQSVTNLLLDVHQIITCDFCYYYIIFSVPAKTSSEMNTLELHDMLDLQDGVTHDVSKHILSSW